MGKKTGTVAVDLTVKDMPEVLATMRLELATLLRAHAQQQWVSGDQNAVDMAVRRALNSVADVFEAGLRDAKDVG